MTRLAAYNRGALPAPPSSAELADYWRPFGADRCMFESNLPVEKMGIARVALWNTLTRLAAEASPAAKRALFSRTARRVYRLREET
jgi:predicted TIM-barrel fold metal-dependent hydrolase